MELSTENYIFYVDDDLDDRMLFEEIVCSLGYKVRMFDNVDLILAALLSRNYHPMAIFTDLNMPKHDGHYLLDKVKRLTFLDDVPIVVLSTSGAADMVRKSYDLGASLYMVKTTSYQAMRDYIAKVLSIDWQNFERDSTSFLINSR